MVWDFLSFMWRHLIVISVSIKILSRMEQIFES